MQRLFRIFCGCALLVLWMGSNTILAGQRDTFRPPLRKVLSLTPEQYVEYYAAHTEYNHQPGTHCGGSFRNAMDYYAECLRKRSDARAKRLPDVQRKQLRQIMAAMQYWLSAYYRWNMLFNINGTFWCDSWAEHNVAQEQLLAHIERNFLTSASISRHQCNAIQQELTAIRAEINHHTIKQVYEDTERKQFARYRRKALQTTADLAVALKLLPSANADSLLRHIKKVRKEVIRNATPGLG